MQHDPMNRDAMGGAQPLDQPQAQAVYPQQAGFGSQPPPGYAHPSNHPPSGHPAQAPAQAGYPQQQAQYPQQQAQYPQQAGYPQQHAQYPQYAAPQGYGAPQPPKAGGTGAGIGGIVTAFLALGPLGLAIYNLHQAQRLSYDLDLPVFARGMVADANLGRVMLFSSVAAGLALVGVVLGVVGRRAIAGKIAIALGAVALVGSAYAQVGRANFDYKFVPGKYERDDEPLRSSGDKRSPMETGSKDSPKPPAAPAPAAPIQNDKQAAFRLGNRLGLSVIARARGQRGPGERTFAELAPLASRFDATLPALPPLSGDQTGDTADAMHYLMDTAGKSVAQKISAKYGEAHATAFELGIKMNLLNLLYLPNDQLGQGLGNTVAERAKRLGIADATVAPLLTKIRANASQQAVGDATFAAVDAIDAELARGVESPAAAPSPAPAPRSKAPAPTKQPAARRPSRPGRGGFAELQ